MKFKKSRNLLLFVILIIFSLQLFGLGFLFFCPVKTASAQVTPGGPTFTPQVDIPGSKFVKGSKQPINGLLIAKYIQAWYKFAVAAVGILAVVMIMGGGLFWLTAGGKADQISTGKDWIVSAVVGLILALMSYTLLDILNPSLVTFESLELPEIEFVDLKNETLKRCEDTQCLEGMICIIKSDGYPACIKDEDHWECSSNYQCDQSETTTPYGAFYCEGLEKLSCATGEDLICCKN